MKTRQSGLTVSVLALAALVGCGSDGGTGPSIPPGPAGSDGSFARQESPGSGINGFDRSSAGEGRRPENPGGPGSGGDTGGGGGGSERQEFITICKELCNRMAATCQVNRDECLAECDELPEPAAMPCGRELFAFMRCARSTRIVCEGEEPLYEGCEAEGATYIECALGEDPGPGEQWD